MSSSGSEVPSTFRRRIASGGTERLMSRAGLTIVPFERRSCVIRILIRCGSRSGVVETTVPWTRNVIVSKSPAPGRAKRCR